MDSDKDTTLDLKHYGLDSKGTMAVAMAMVVSFIYLCMSHKYISVPLYVKFLPWWNYARSCNRLGFTDMPVLVIHMTVAIP